MRVEQRVGSSSGWDGAAALVGAQLVLVFGGRHALLGEGWLARLRADYPRALLFGCSTAGEIAGTRVLDDTIVASAVELERSRVAMVHVDLADTSGSEDAGRRLAGALNHDGLRHVVVLSDGQKVNGSDLVRGLAGGLPRGVSLTGGLAGDGPRFEETYVLAGELRANAVAAIGLYGADLRVGYGSLGGWDAFGPLRRVTRSEGNVLFELDGKPALELYKTYLGEHAAGLPATGLLFPLNVTKSEGERALVRTILSVDEARQSVTFAGDVPEGALAQLMKANFDRLIEGAEGAARASVGDGTAELALLISCVGRKLVLRQRTEEEVESVRDVLGEQAALTGFYSYGEICPAFAEADCQLHNQTMTITTLSERPAHRESAG
jgi:hypothetical protein